MLPLTSPTRPSIATPPQPDGRTICGSPPIAIQQEQPFLRENYWQFFCCCFSQNKKIETIEVADIHEAIQPNSQKELEILERITS